MDLSKLSDAQLLALHSGDYSKLSDDELKSLYGSAGGETTPDVSQLESALRGAAQGASLGFADEGAGALEALKDKLLDHSSDNFADLYRKHRDESRAAYDAAEKANPKTFLAGELGGGAATALVPGLNIAKGATLAGRAAMAGGLGAAAGLGTSKADVTQGEGAQALKDAAIGGATGTVLQPALENANPLLNYILKKTNRAVLGVPEGVTERYLANPEAINKAKSLPEIASKLPEVLSQVKEDTGPLAEAAKSALSGERTPAKGIAVNDVLSRLDDIIQSSSDPGKLRVLKAMRNKVMRDYQGRLGQIDLAHPNYMTEQELKPVIQTLQDAGDFRSPVLSSDRAKINQSSGTFNSLLKGQNPDYAAAQSDVARQVQLKNGLIKKFGLERDLSNPDGYTSTDRTISALKQLPKENRIDRAKVAGELNDLGYGNLGADVQNAADKAAFSADTTNGSRRVWLGGAVGSALSHTMGVPYHVGAAIGAGAGAFADKYGPQVAKFILDSKLMTEKGLGKVANSQFGGVIANAAKKGNSSLATTMYILSGQSPEFRSLLKDDNEAP